MAGHILETFVQENARSNKDAKLTQADKGLLQGVDHQEEGRRVERVLDLVKQEIKQGLHPEIGS